MVHLNLKCWKKKSFLVEPCVHHSTHGSVQDDDQIDPTSTQVHSLAYDDDPTQKHKAGQTRSSQAQDSAQKDQGKPTAALFNSQNNKATVFQFSIEQPTLQHCLSSNQMSHDLNNAGNIISTHGPSHQGL